MQKFNTQAIFSDQTSNFVRQNTDGFEIFLRVAKGDIDEAHLVIGGLDVPMQKSHSKGLFDFYRTFVTPQNAINYHFVITTHKERFLYNNNGFDFVLNPNFDVPNWAQNTVMYQIFIDRFCNGDSSNDVVAEQYTYMGYPAKSMKWDDEVENVDIANFYGGDLEGIAQKMDYLADLGIETIYLNPIFASPSSHKYDISDYENVDPHFGNNALLADLIALAHSKGIKVILDGVFNHCGHLHRWLQTHPKYFLWKDGKYEAWWGHENHPKLNFEASPELYEKMLNIAEEWVSPPYNADGWRLDVAADLGQSPEFNLRFWQDFRKRVKAANPNAFILAEHYGDPTYWLAGDAWDSVMNYDGFMEPISWFFTGMQKHSEKFLPHLLNNANVFVDTMRNYAAKLPYPALASSMNQLSNHDHSRFLTRTNMNVGRLHTHGSDEAKIGIQPAIMLSAITMQFTLPGCPTIYYGDEAGLCGWTDPDNRRPYPWGKEDTSMLAFHKEIIRIHKSHPALRGGSLEYLDTEHGIITYGRWNNDQSVICAFNNTHVHKNIAIPAWRANVSPNTTMQRVLLTTDGNFITEPKEYILDEGTLFLMLPPMSSAILVSG